MKIFNWNENDEIMKWNVKWKKTIVSPEIAATLCTSIGLVNELNSNQNDAYFYFQKGFVLWKDLKQNFYALLCIKHLIYLESLLQNEFTEKSELPTVLNAILEEEKIDFDSATALFEDFEKKIFFGKNVIVFAFKIFIFCVFSSLRLWRSWNLGYMTRKRQQCQRNSVLPPLQ